tara:strand:- start:1170 stop:1358 length:189 start_codon:yes stop_codon:yes gene_type:complete
MTDKYSLKEAKKLVNTLNNTMVFYRVEMQEEDSKIKRDLTQKMQDAIDDLSTTLLMIQDGKQ